MRYEIIYRYKKEKFLDVKYIYARNEGAALIQFWTFILHFRDKNNVEFVRITEKNEE